MPNPFGDMVDRIQAIGYRNHRREEHSDVVNGIDIDAEYGAMIAKICRAYAARWHS